MSAINSDECQDVEFLKHSLAAQNIQINQIQNLYSNLVVERNTLDGERKLLQNNLLKMEQELTQTKRQWNETSKNYLESHEKSHRQENMIQTLESKLAKETALIQEQTSKIQVQNSRVEELERQISKQQQLLEDLTKAQSLLLQANETLSGEAAKTDILTKRLYTDLEKKEQETQQFGKMIEELQSEKRTLKENITEKHSHSKRMESEIEELERAIDDLHAFALRAKTQEEKSKGIANHFQTDAALTKNNFQEFIGELTHCKNELFAIRDTSILEGEEFEKFANLTRKKTVEDLESLLAEKNQQLVLTLKKNSQLEEQNQSFAHELNSFKSKTFSLEGQIKSLNHSLLEAQTAQRNTLHNLQELQSNNYLAPLLQGELDKLKMDLQNLRLENSQLKIHNSKITILESQNQELQEKLLAEKGLNLSLQETQKDLEGKNQSLVEQLNLQGEISSKKIQELSLQFENLSSQMNNLEQKNWNLNEESQTKTRENNALKDQLQFLYIEIQQEQKLRSNLEDIQQKQTSAWNEERAQIQNNYENRQRFLDEQISTLNEEFQIKFKECNTLKDQLNLLTVDFQQEQKVRQNLEDIQQKQTSAWNEERVQIQSNYENRLSILEKTAREDIEKWEQEKQFKWNAERDCLIEKIQSLESQLSVIGIRLELREDQLKNYNESLNFEKGQLMKSIQEFSDELALAGECNPIKDYLKATEFQLSRLEIQLKRTPALASERPALEEALSQLIEQRDFLKSILLNSEKQLLARSLKLSSLLRNGQLAKVPPLPPFTIDKSKNLLKK